MKIKLFLALLSTLGIAIAHDVSQSITFSGFPHGTTYTNSSSDTPEDCGGAPDCLPPTSTYNPNTGSVSDSGPDKVYFPKAFPPIFTLDRDDEKYYVDCDGTCSKTMTTTIKYNDTKTCTLTVVLGVTNTNALTGAVSHSHTNSMSGDCTIDGGEGDALWVVQPKS